MALGKADVLSLGPSIQTFSLGDLSHTRCKGLGKPLIGQRKHDATAEQRVCMAVCWFTTTGPRLATMKSTVHIQP